MPKFARSDEPKVNKCQIKSKAHPATGSGWGLKMLKNKIMVRLRRELSRTLVEPLILNFAIHLALGF